MRLVTVSLWQVKKLKLEVDETERSTRDGHPSKFLTGSVEEIRYKLGNLLQE